MMVQWYESAEEALNAALSAGFTVTFFGNEVPIAECHPRLPMFLDSDGGRFYWRLEYQR